MTRIVSQDSLECIQFRSGIDIHIENTTFPTLSLVLKVTYT